MIEITALKQLANEYTNLEQKLSANSQPPPDQNQASSAQSVNQLLSVLFSAYNEAKNKDSFISLSFEESFSDKLHANRKTLSAIEFFSLNIVDAFFKYIFEEVKLHESAQVHLFPLKVVMAKQTLMDQSLLENPAESLFQLLEMFIQVAKYIDNNSGKRGSKLLSAMSDIGSKLAQKPQLTHVDFEKALLAFNDYLTRFREESNRIEALAIRNETKEVAEQDARVQVNSEIAKHTEGEELPAFVIDFLQNVWSKYLKLTLLQYGQDSLQWRSAAEDIRILVWSITGPFDEVFQQQFMSLIPAAMKRIFQCLDSMHYDKEETSRFFHSLEAIHADILAGRRISVDTIIVASIFDELEGDALRIQAIDEKDGGIHAKFKTGDWVKLLINDDFVLCKILSKFRVPDKTIFVNVSGEVVKIISTSALEQYNSRQILPIKQSPVIQPALRYSESLFQQNITRLRNKYRDAVAEKSKENLKQKLKVLQEKQKREKGLYEKRIKEEAKRRWQAEKKRAEEEERLKDLHRQEQERENLKYQSEVAKESEARVKAQELASQLAQEKQKMAEETARLAQEKAEMEARMRELAQEKAKLEAQAKESDKERNRLANEAKKAEQEARRVANQAAAEIEKEQFEKKCLENIERVIPGTWLEIEVEPEKSISCKLGLVLQSSKKMIFVDRSGAQVFEATKPQLLALLLSKKATILEFGVEFESTLESLVISRRKNLTNS